MSGVGVEWNGLSRRFRSVAIERMPAAAVAFIVPACLHPVYDRPTCGAHGECPVGSSCSAQNICEGKFEVVDGGPTTVDTPSPDARLCFGDPPFTICLAAPPIGAVDAGDDEPVQHGYVEHVRRDDERCGWLLRAGRHHDLGRSRRKVARHGLQTARADRPVVMAVTAPLER
jgi:hypothetical protein